MNRKRILTTAAVAVGVLAGVSLLGAYEAHVINVKAHIENALAVSPANIDFGVVFPEETLLTTFQVNLSGSFLEQDRVDDVHYALIQKPKPKTVEDPRETIYPNSFPNGIAAWDYCLNETGDAQYYDYCYRNLCPYLEKLAQDAGDTEDSAWLGISQNDLEDIWSIGFVVPCIEGYTPQGEDCETVPEEDDYGCDIWVEVEGLSLF